MSPLSCWRVCLAAGRRGCRLLSNRASGFLATGVASRCLDFGWHGLSISDNQLSIEQRENLQQLLNADGSRMRLDVSHSGLDNAKSLGEVRLRHAP